MELRHLEQVAAVGRTGSFSAAARVLGIAQPTLSQSIARLEATLGVRLFVRGPGGGAVATAEGQLISERAQPLLDGAAALREDLRALARQETPRLSLGAGPVPGLILLPQIVRAFAARFPEVSITAEHDMAKGLLEAVAQGRLDAAFLSFEVVEPYGDLIRVKVLEDSHVAVSAPGHPLVAEPRPIGPRQLLAHPMAVARLVPSFRRWAGELSGEEARNVQAFVSNDFGLIKSRAIEAGLVTMGPRGLFRAEIAAGSLVELPLTWDTPYECWMLTTSDRWRSPMVKAVAEVARSAAKQPVSAGAAPGERFNAIDV